MNTDNASVRRVLMTADTVGGVWTYALELACALGKRGVNVDLATMGSRLSPSQARTAAAIPTLTIHESEYRLEWMDDPWADVDRASDWLLTLENELEPDVVHLNGYAHGNLPWRAPHIVVGHSCVLSWWRAVKGEEAPANWARYRDAVTEGLRSADCVIAPSRAMLSDLDHYYGPLQSTAVVPNACEPTRFRPRRKHELVLAAGRVWDEAKNVAILGRLNPSGMWPIYVAGDVRHPDGRVPRVDNVRLLGVLPPNELSEWYGRAAIYCLPALYEPFGLSVLEAAHSGCALILGDIPSLRENWSGAATFVPALDPDAISRALRELSSNTQRRSALSALAHERAAKFSPACMSAGYLNLYRDVVLRHAAAPAVAEGH